MAKARLRRRKAAARPAERAVDAFLAEGVRAPLNGRTLDGG